jgi:hypothetical protein
MTYPKRGTSFKSGFNTENSNLSLTSTIPDGSMEDVKRAKQQVETAKEHLRAHLNKQSSDISDVSPRSQPLDVFEPESSNTSNVSPGSPFHVSEPPLTTSPSTTISNDDPFENDETTTLHSNKVSYDEAFKDEEGGGRRSRKPKRRRQSRKIKR